MVILIAWKPRVEGAWVFSSVFICICCISGAGSAREPDSEGGWWWVKPAFVASLAPPSTGKHLDEHSQVQSSYLHSSLSLSVCVFVLKVEFVFVMYLCLSLTVISEKVWNCSVFNPQGGGRG